MRERDSKERRRAYTHENLAEKFNRLLVRNVYDNGRDEPDCADPASLLRQLGIQDTALIEQFSRIAFGVTYIVAAVFSPIWGHAADKVGRKPMLLRASLGASLIVGGLLFIPQAFVKSPWQLMALRFLVGLAIAGLAPSINALVKRITPDALTGRIFGLIMSAQYLGIFGGSIIGGQVAAYFGIQCVFFITSILLLINALWVYRKVYKKLNGESKIMDELT